MALSWQLSHSNLNIHFSYKISYYHWHMIYMTLVSQAFPRCRHITFGLTSSSTRSLFTLAQFIVYTVYFYCVCISNITIFMTFYDLFVNIFDEVYCTFEESLRVRFSLYHLHPVHVQINSDQKVLVYVRFESHNSLMFEIAFYL